MLIKIIFSKQFEALQVAATAKGKADAAIESARGEAESTKLNAEAEKTRLLRQGEGLQANLEDQIKPFGTADKYVAYLQAKASLQWNGQLPTTMIPGSVLPFMNIAPPAGANAR